MPVNIENARTIEGWMLIEELNWLAEQAAKHELIVELGSYCGRSTRALADNAKGTVIAVDHWYGPGGRGNSKPPDPNSDTLTSSGVPWTDGDRELLFDSFMKNMGVHVTDGKVVPVRLDHSIAQFDERLRNLEPDMVFIDGDHDYEPVKRDILNWLPRLKKGGLMSGHDGNQYTVLKAAQEVMGEVFIAPYTTIWYAVK